MSQIGLGSSVAIDEVTPLTFVVVPNVTSLGVPDVTLNTTESKRLDITNSTIRKIPTMFDRGEVTFTYEFDSTTKDRLDGIRDAKTENSYRFTIEFGATDWTETLKGYLTKNVVNEVVADEIVTCTATVVFSGED